MKQFKTDIYEGLPPFACCLYHKQINPKDENFLDMLRFTFMPYFQLYSFTFFWFIIIAFVFFCEIYMSQSNAQDEFLQVSQSVLFELGENYPFYIVKKYHYYRLITSIVLFRNLYHFIMASIGILIFGSYIEELIGFKRIFLLSVTSGVGGELIRNVFLYSASIESITPICGLIGYLMGLYHANKDGKWKYLHNEKVHIILITLMVLLPYAQLGVIYKNISGCSMVAALIIGFIFYFCDPNCEKYNKYKMPAIVFLVLILAISAFCVFFKIQPQLLEIR